MNKTKRILAMIGVILLVALYLGTLVLAILGKISSLCSWRLFPLRLHFR